MPPPPPSPLDGIPGQPRAVHALQAALKSGHTHHAYLFAGPEGVGKGKAAVALAQALTCPEAPGVGCGRCAACGRVERGTHPDVHWLMSEAAQVGSGRAGKSDFERTPSRDIRVEQVRQLQDKLARRPLEAKHKVVLVMGADALNDAAQNAFLKTLEEPPSDTVLILVTAAPHLLLPTLRSRLSRVPFGPLTEVFVMERLRQAGHSEEEARQAAFWAQGSLGLAEQLDAKALTERASVIQSFEALKPGDARPLLRFAEAFGGAREDAEGALQALLAWNAALARVQAGSGTPPGVLEALALTRSREVSPPLLQKRHRLMTETLERVRERNGAPRLQLERLLLEVFEVVA